MEQFFADVTSGPLAHMPSGVFAANAAWLSIAAMAHNLVLRRLYSFVIIIVIRRWAGKDDRYFFPRTK